MYLIWIEELQHPQSWNGKLFKLNNHKAAVTIETKTASKAVNSYEALQIIHNHIC